MSSAPATPPPAPAPAPAAPQRRRGQGTALDMVRSLAVILALVAVVVLLFAQPRGSQRPAADVAGSVALARAAGLPVAAPRLPGGWTATGARFSPDTAEGLPTWHVGYLDPAGGYGGVDVTKGSTPAWVVAVAGESAARAGDRTLAGATWQVWRASDPASTTLVRVDGATSTAVTSRGTSARLEELATAAAAAVGGAAVQAAGAAAGAAGTAAPASPPAPAPAGPSASG